MYHTECYIDHEGVDSNQHMISFAGKMENRDIIVWAVWKNRELPVKNRERFQTWFSMELGAAITKGETEVKKELVRICSGMQCRMYLYDGQKLYRAGDKVEEGEFCMDSSLGASLHTEGTAAIPPLREELNRMKNELAKENACVSEKGLSGIGALGNIWQKNIMDCIVKDSLSYAYFMLWEVR
ncbi:MAG: hypothetical protein LUI10_03905 [Lachnospiraceae bacterium]|nr:hypothetical protein [Lachnospiraceae bacterium]